MGSQGQGRLGLVFLVAALVLMPVLVFAYDPEPDSDAAVVRVSSEPTGTALASGAPTTSPPTRPPGAPAIVEIEGIGNGLPLRGSTKIYAVVAGDVGGVLFRVEGPKVTFYYRAVSQPYLLDPHEPQQGAWDTTFVPNGEYTLTATSVADPEAWKSVRFIVRNS